MNHLDLREFRKETARLRAGLHGSNRGPAGRLRGFLKRKASSRRMRFLLLAAVLTVAAASYAGQISVTSFNDGDVAYAGPVNSNFTTLVNESNTQDTRITTLENKDHGDFGGLADDDHTQYVLVSGARAITGNLTVNGSTTLGDAGGDTTSVSGNGSIAGNLSVSGDSTLGASGDVATIDDVLKLTPRSSAPSCNRGAVYFDSTGFGALCVCVGSATVNVWQSLGPGACL